MAQHETSTGSSISERVILKMATYTNTPLSDLPPIYEAIEPDALDSLFDEYKGTRPLRVEFAYNGHMIVVAQEEITLNELQPPKSTTQVSAESTD